MSLVQLGGLACVGAGGGGLAQRLGTDDGVVPLAWQ